MIKNILMRRTLYKGLFVFLGCLLWMGIAENTHAAGADDFVITVKTDNTGSSSNTQFTIPTTDGGAHTQFVLKIM
ncbi:MAG: hypothetical protein CR972_01650 [Candidatus Moraniibacteriota bacterium]|nr:MAG: hypothetical protein CR972_01650 [Candidatus Moranbacteria bacterium]